MTHAQRYQSPEVQELLNRKLADTQLGPFTGREFLKVVSHYAKPDCEIWEFRPLLDKILPNPGNEPLHSNLHPVRMLVTDFEAKGILHQNHYSVAFTHDFGQYVRQQLK